MSRYLNIQTFGRFDADCVMKNIYETFDSANTGDSDSHHIAHSLAKISMLIVEGRVSQNEILWVFSMAMNGTGFHQRIVNKYVLV